MSTARARIIKSAIIGILALFSVSAHAQCTVGMWAPHPQFFSNTGAVLSGGKVFFYQAGTAAAQDTYVDSTCTTKNPNPVVLDSGGYPPNNTGLWLTTNSYKMVVQDSSGVQQWSADNVSLASAAITAPLGTNNTFTGTNTFSGAANLNGGGALAGTFSGAPTFSGNVIFSGTPNFNINNCSNALTYNSTTHAWGCNAIAGTGTVTSVGMTVPSGFSISGSPVASSGTLALGFATAQTNQRVLGTGSAGQLALRALDHTYFNSGTGASSSTFLRGDDVWSNSLTNPIINGATLSGTITNSGTISGGTVAGAIMSGTTVFPNSSDIDTNGYAHLHGYAMLQGTTGSSFGDAINFWYDVPSHCFQVWVGTSMVRSICADTP